MRIRLYVPGEVHHVISRLTDRRFYLNLDGARAEYVRLFAASLRESDWRCIGYALMSNHIHHVMVAGQRPPDSWYRHLNAPFAKWLNKVHGGLGTIYADRPSVYVVPEAEVARTLAYVHNNPVRAKVARTATESTWTSHRAYVGLDAAPEWLSVAEGMRRSGITSAEEFDRWVQVDVEGSEATRAAEEFVHRATRLARRRGAVEACSPVVGGTPSVTLVARPFAHVRPDPSEVIEVIARLTAVPSAIIRSRGRMGMMGRRLVLAAGTAAGLSAAELCAALGVSRQMGSRLLRSNQGLDDRVLSLAADALRQTRSTRGS